MKKTLPLVMISLMIMCTFSVVKASVKAEELYKWPMFHRDIAHTGYTSESIGPAFEVAWTFETGGWVESSPAVVGGTVFFGSDDGKMYALNARVC